jgi:type I restriction enzyme S subunit
VPLAVSRKTFSAPAARNCFTCASRLWPSVDTLAVNHAMILLLYGGVSWRDCTLGDVVKLQRGHDLPDRLRREGSVPVVSSSGVTGRHSEAKAESPGVVTGRYGTIGEVFFVEEPYWPLNTALYVVDFKGNDPRFVSYLLRNTLRNYKTEKAAVPGVDRNVLHLLKVRAPDAPIQKSIVSILSAYDDLIENNRRRIALLEEAARMLYREWFVHFRFPGDLMRSFSA